MQKLSLLALLLIACDSSSGPVGVVVGKTTVQIDTREISSRVGEIAIGDWMSDLLKRKMGALGNTVDVALINAGAIRGGTIDTKTGKYTTADGKVGHLYLPGNLTDLDIEGWFPFHDDHTIVTITGTQLKSILERGVSQLPPDLKNGEAGNFLQVSGLRFTVDCSGTRQQLDAMSTMIVTEGTRISHLEVNGAVVWDPASSVDKLAATTLNVVVNSFVASGGDGHLAFKTGTVVQMIPYASFNFAQAMVDEVKATTPIAPVADGRIQIVGSCGQPLTQP
jgi:5'-nucleotidase